jgi:spore coat protein A
MSKRAKLLRLVLMFVILLAGTSGQADASTLIPQTWMPGECIPQFKVKMPVFGPGYNADLPRVDAVTHPQLTVTMKETSRQVLPNPSTVLYPATDSQGAACPKLHFNNTRIWAYETSDRSTGQLLGPAFWPAVTVENQRLTPTLIEYVNQLPSFSQGGVMQGLITVDQTVHFADPLGTQMANDCMFAFPLPDACVHPYIASPPAVPHLHGSEVPSAFDGGPEAWFTADGKTGAAYASLTPVGPGRAVYEYPNAQEPGTLWFHDHALGVTRTNVYSGLATFYFLRDPQNEPANLPGGPYEIEMAIQDRQFDTNSQLFFPDGSGSSCGSEAPGDPCLNGPPPNPGIHPFWNPEFIGDVAVVNGSPWPFFNVEPRRYRFRVLNGSNARFYRLSADRAFPAYAIGADDAYIDTPVALTRKLLLGPGERADIIVDFSGLAGQTVTIKNDAPTPFPDGISPVTDQPRMAQIMQFRVMEPLRGTDTSCNPAAGECGRPTPLVRLTDGNGNIAPGVKIDKVRQLVLKEFEGEGGPIEVLVNNTDYDGRTSPGIVADFADGVSELPQVGAVELWEIINLTGDAHPMHTHLVQFQILNRQDYNFDAYAGELGVWASAFPAAETFNPVCTGGVFCPRYGPPLSYNTPNADGAIGGNPAISPYLIGAPTPPDPWEAGWKDLAKALPAQVLRLVVRWQPTSTPVTPDVSFAGTNFYPFDPTEGPGYVWHCHIIDHEDNEMMRPYKVAK